MCRTDTPNVNDYLVIHMYKCKEHIERGEICISFPSSHQYSCAYCSIRDGTRAVLVRSDICTYFAHFWPAILRPWIKYTIFFFNFNFIYRSSKFLFERREMCAFDGRIICVYIRISGLFKIQIFCGLRETITFTMQLLASKVLLCWYLNLKYWLMFCYYWLVFKPIEIFETISTRI